MMRRAAAILIASGGVLYAAWFLQWAVPTDLSATSSYISELSATDQPHHWLFRTTDLLAGLSLVLGSVAAMSSTPRSRWMLTGWASLLLFGVSTIADSLTPLSCAPTASESCRRLTEHAKPGGTVSLHLFTSVAEDLFFGVAMLSLMIVAWRIGVPVVLRRVATGVMGAIIVSWAWTLAAAAEFEFLHIDDQLGVAQRTEVALTGAWLVLVSIELLRVRADRPSRTP
jgi:hypothetical protein